MSATEELIQNIYEFRGLLSYLGENYPKILTEWKNKNAVVTSDSRTEPVPEQVT